MHITIRWTPGHRDVPGNERADEEAKRASQEGSSEPDTIPPYYRSRCLPRSRSAVLQQFTADLKAKVAREWTKSPRYHRIRRYDPTLPLAKYLDIADRMPRKLAVIILQLRIGHTILNKHLHRIKRADTPVCPACHHEDETIMHYLLHCPAHANAREELHRTRGRSSRVLDKLLVLPKLLPLLLQFVARSARYRTVFGEIPDMAPLDHPLPRERIKEINALVIPKGLFPPQVPEGVGPDYVLLPHFPPPDS